MNIGLGDHFGYGKLVRFTLPTMGMMLFTSIYSIVDGYFVSNYVGKIPFASVNLMMPVFGILGSLGFMLGEGGNALVGKLLGEGEKAKANETFSLVIYFLAIFSLAVGVAGLFFIGDLVDALGAKGEMRADCITYGSIMLPTLPFFTIQYAAQPFLVTAERPRLGFAIAVASGLTNIALDALFIAVFGWGIRGAAWATVIAEMTAGLMAVVYFARPNTSLLRLTKTRWNGAALWQSATNGVSEFLSNISMSVVGLAYNWQLLRMAGEDGVAAYGVMGYTGFIFTAMFMGYSMGAGPLASYNYGAQNTKELSNIYGKSMRIVALMGVGMFLMAEVMAVPIANLFVGYDQELATLTERGFRIYSLTFLLCGTNIYASSFFTALNNGWVSGAISFGRTMIFELAAVLSLPLWLGTDGIWLSAVVAEVAAIILSLGCLAKFRNRYGY